MVDFKYVKFLTILFILIISISFAAATDSGGESTIVTQDNDSPDVYGDSSKEVYVDPSQSSGGNGSKESPYNSIQSALDNLDAQTSNTIILKDGIYKGEANTKVSLIGNLVVKADEGANPTIDGDGQGTNFWTLTDSNILLHGITFKNFNRVYYNNQAILSASNIENLTVSGCIFENNTYTRAMYLDHLNNTVIDGCTLQDYDAQYLDGGGIYSKYVNNLTFSNNIAQNLKDSNYRYGAVLYSNYNANVTIVGNRFTNITGGSGSGVYSSYDKKIKFVKNYFDDVGGNGYSVSGHVLYINYPSDGFDFINNTVKNCRSSYSGSVYVYGWNVMS